MNWIPFCHLAKKAPPRIAPGVGIGLVRKPKAIGDRKCAGCRKMKTLGAIPSKNNSTVGLLTTRGLANLPDCLIYCT
jgi:hypothetical protein